MTRREAEIATTFLGGAVVCQQLMRLAKGHAVVAYMVGFTLGLFAHWYSGRKE